jgi:hypothetical protein
LISRRTKRSWIVHLKVEGGGRFLALYRWEEPKMDYEQRVLEYKALMRGGLIVVVERFPVVQDMPHKLATRCLLFRLFGAMLLRGASRGSLLKISTFPA